MAGWIILGALALGIAVFENTQATMGVGLGILACFLGIVVRITQAETEQKRLLAAILSSEPKS